MCIRDRYVEFGSGFKIAMRDLEIRGAGNLLGPEQSGYMMSVGYDMYLQLLEDAVLEDVYKRQAPRSWMWSRRRMMPGMSPMPSPLES